MTTSATEARGGLRSGVMRLAGVAWVVLVVSACGSTSGAVSPSADKNGTVGGTINGSTNLGAVAGIVTGSIATSGAMTGAISGTISGGSASPGGIHSTAATTVSFSGSASGTHGSGRVTGTLTGTTSDGGTFSGTFTGPVDGTTRTYTASGNISFSGTVTGTVAVALSGDCPSSGNDTPDLPPSPAPPGGDGGGTPGPPVPPPGPAASFTGAWAGTYVLNGTAGTMTWSMAGSVDGGLTNQGTYIGSLGPMPGGSVVLGPVNADNSLTLKLQLACTNGNGGIVFQGTGQLSGGTITGALPALGGGNCAAGVPWTVSVTMKKS